MAYNASKLITRAWNLSGIVPRGLNTVGADKMSDGFELLNSLLSTNSLDMRLIPYFSSYSFNAVIGQEKYHIPNLLEVETFTFTINTVRYSTREVNRKEYFGSPRANNIQSLPYSWHTERVLGGIDLYIYFLPNTTYPLVIFGKFALQELSTPDDDLLTYYDLFYIEYLRYALAQYMCQEYNRPFLQEKKLQELEIRLMDLSPPDLTVTKISSLEDQAALNYAIINFGGWVPS